MITLKASDIVTVYTYALAGLPPIAEVQIDEIILTELLSDDEGDEAEVLGYSAKIIGKDQTLLVLPEDIIYVNTIH